MNQVKHGTIIIFFLLEDQLLPADTVDCTAGKTAGQLPTNDHIRNENFFSSNLFKLQSMKNIVSVVTKVFSP